MAKIEQLQQKFKILEAKLQTAYEEQITQTEAEALAGEFLHAQIMLSSQLAKVELDARMRKSGVKAIRAAMYLEIVSNSEKKPTEAGMTAMLDSNELVNTEQKALDEAEVSKNELERIYDIYTNAHIYFRTIAKGSL
jgi:hypothetical protein